MPGVTLVLADDGRLRRGPLAERLRARRAGSPPAAIGPGRPVVGRLIEGLDEAQGRALQELLAEDGLAAALRPDDERPAPPELCRPRQVQPTAFGARLVTDHRGTRRVLAWNEVAWAFVALVPQREDARLLAGPGARPGGAVPPAHDEAEAADEATGTPAAALVAAPRRLGFPLFADEGEAPRPDAPTRARLDRPPVALHLDLLVPDDRVYRFTLGQFAYRRADADRQPSADRRADASWRELAQAATDGGVRPAPCAAAYFAGARDDRLVFEHEAELRRYQCWTLWRALVEGAGAA